MDQVERDWSFTWVPNTVVEDDRLSEHAKMVYLSIARYASNDLRQAFPSIASIERIARIKRQTVINAKKELIEYGYLTQQTREDEAGRQTNLYTLHSVSQIDPPRLSHRPPPSTTQTTPVYEIDPNYTHRTIPIELGGDVAEIDETGTLIDGDTKYTDPVEYADLVVLSPLQYARLTCEFGAARIDDVIERISLWQRAKKGKAAYKDYNAAIRDWLRRDGQAPNNDRHKCPNCGNDTFDGIACHLCGHTVDFGKIRSQAVANL
jgi:hypothetical protein